MRKLKITNNRCKHADDRRCKIDVEYSSDLDNLIARRTKYQDQRQSKQ